MRMLPIRHADVATIRSIPAADKPARRLMPIALEAAFRLSQLPSETARRKDAQ